jgi:3-hydroxybutyryl-CoA dehydrogenase
MSHIPTSFVVVGVVSNADEQTPFLQALQDSGRDVSTVDGSGARAGQVDLLVVPVAPGREVPIDAVVAAATAIDAPVPILIEAETVPATEVAARLPEPGRVLVVHRFDTGPGRHIIEVVPALQTEQAVLQQVVDLVDGLEGLSAVVAKDRPGYLLNALFLPYLNDVIQELDDGLATAADIDVALKLGLGYQVGPFELLDRMGLDRHLMTTSAVHEATRDPRFAPPPLLSRAVAAGRLGTASGGGFHDQTTAHQPGDTA